MAVCGFCHQQITGTDYKTYKSKRYHNSCFEEMKQAAERKEKKVTQSSSKKEQELLSLSEYVCSVFALKEMPKSLIRQAENIQATEGLTFSQIEKGLWWFYQIEGHTPDLSRPNLGIAPYAYEEYQAFIEKIENAIENNEKVELKNEVVFVKPFSPTETRMKMLTNMNDL